VAAVVVAALAAQIPVDTVAGGMAVSAQMSAAQHSAAPTTGPAYRLSTERRLP